jgi:hypothetical protein
MVGCGASVCALVVLVVQCAGAEDLSGLRGVVRHVEEAIRKEMMIEPVRYSDPNLTAPYQASAQFNARGMANLYKVTNFFMDIIQREAPYPEGKSLSLSLMLPTAGLTLSRPWFTVSLMLPTCRTHTIPSLVHSLSALP